MVHLHVLTKFLWKMASFQGIVDYRIFYLFGNAFLKFLFFMASARNIGNFLKRNYLLQKCPKYLWNCNCTRFSFPSLTSTIWQNVLTILSQLGRNALIHCGMCHLTEDYSHGINCPQLF